MQTATLLASGITMELTPEMHATATVQWGMMEVNIYQMTDNTLLEAYVDGKSVVSHQYTRHYVCH